MITVTQNVTTKCRIKTILSYIHTCGLCCRRHLGDCQVGRAQQKVGSDCGVESVLSVVEVWRCGWDQVIVAGLASESGLVASLFFAQGLLLCWWRSQRVMPV